MQSDGLVIRKHLEETFDIPFVVSRKNENQEPIYTISPLYPGKELFDIQISIRNKVRLLIEFIPQRYSVNFISGMGHQGIDNRKIFSEYVRLIKEKGAKCIVRVNNAELDMENPESWPDTWKSFEARVTKMPITIESEEHLLEIIKDWLSLMMGLVLSLADIISFDTDVETLGYAEGNKNKVEVDRYERNPLNRKLCLESKGYACQICGMDFEENYGEIGYHFIHVHHIVPVSQIGEGYIINPMEDLIPICPNCHAMLHRKNPPLSPNELKQRIRSTGKHSSPEDVLIHVAEKTAEYKAQS